MHVVFPPMDRFGFGTVHRQLPVVAKGETVSAWCWIAAAGIAMPPVGRPLRSFLAA
jgi:hypothetical protein